MKHKNWGCRSQIAIFVLKSGFPNFLKQLFVPYIIQQSGHTTTLSSLRWDIVFLNCDTAFRWSDGTPIDYTNYLQAPNWLGSPTQPANEKPREDVTAYQYNEGWSDCPPHNEIPTLVCKQKPKRIDKICFTTTKRTTTTTTTTKRTTTPRTTRTTTLIRTILFENLPIETVTHVSRNTCMV